MNMLSPGDRLTRKEISEAFGGSPVHALPYANGTVVAICLRIDMNPGAPNIILIAKGPLRQKNAKLLNEKTIPTPLFMNRSQADRRLTYEGDFIALDYSEDHEYVGYILSQYKRCFAHSIAGILHMRMA